MRPQRRTFFKHSVACLILLGLAVSGARAAPPLTLSVAIADALRHQPRVQEAARVRAVGRDLARAARALRLPQLGLVSAGIWTQVRDGTPLYASANGVRELIGQLRVSVPIFAPEYAALARAARDRAAVAAEEEEVVRLRVAAQVVDAYYALALLQQQEKIWQSALADSERLYTATRRAYKAGGVSRLDRVQTALMRNRARSVLLQIAGERRAATRVLALLLGTRRWRRPVTLVSVTSPRRALPTMQGVRRATLQEQPLLRVATREIRLGRTQLGLERAARLPTLSGQVAYGVDTPTGIRGRDLGWQVGLSLSMPLYGFGVHEDRVAAAKEQLAALRYARRALLLQLDTRLATDLAAARTARAGLRTAAVGAREAGAVYRMTRKGYLAGALDALELAQAQSAWTRARLRLDAARIAVRMTAVQLDLDEGHYPGEREVES